MVARPPGFGAPRLDVIDEAPDPDPRRRLAVEWIVRDELADPAIAVEQLPHDVEDPDLFERPALVGLVVGGRRAPRQALRRIHRGEPDQPVEPAVIRAEHARPAIEATGLARELVLLPGRPERIRIERAFD